MDTTSNNESELTIAMDRLIFNMGRWSRGIDELAKEIQEFNRATGKESVAENAPAQLKPSES